MGRIDIRAIMVEDARKARHATLSYLDKILAPLGFSALTSGR
jgi:hypothetical protein